MQTFARVAALWRYPVKSMAGEPCTSLTLDASGVEGDRRYALRSAEAPLGAPLLASAQRTSLIPLPARTGSAGQPPSITLATGQMLPITDPNLPAAILPGASGLDLLQNAAKPFTDVRPIALHSLRTIAQLTRELGRPFDPRRLRSNIILDLSPFAESEDLLSGRNLRLGAAVTLHLLERIPRCRIISLDPDTAEPDRTLLTHLARHHGGRAGIYAATLTPGILHVDDPVTLDP